MLSKSNNNAINIITLIAIIGIIVGAASLFVVLSGFDGLKEFTLQFSSLADPDLKATPVTGKTFTITPNTEKKLNAINGIESYSKTIEERILTTFDGTNYSCTLKGVDSNYKKVTAVDSILFAGNWLTQNTNQVVVGWNIAHSLSMGILDHGKRLTLYVPKPGKGQISSVKDAFTSLTALNVGIFDINENLNNSQIYSSINLARELLGFKTNQVSHLEFKLRPNSNEKDVIAKIKLALGKNCTIKNRAQLNDALYKMLQTENLAVYLIFTLVLIIALFNVIGSLIMMILDKKKNLKTLFNIGVNVDAIKTIFFLQGALMSIIGGSIGIAIGLVIITLQKLFFLVMITPSLPYPVSITFKNVVIVFLTITVLGIIASKIASTRISKSLIEVN